jgi:V/A-type H+-transporting ATPase subunit D
MAAVKLTKNELKKQKDALKRFERYLPTLMLKKQQLQLVIRQAEAAQREKQRARDTIYKELKVWIAVFGEEIAIEELVRVGELETDTGNIAGVDIPQFVAIEFDTLPYDLFRTPLWVDSGCEVLKRLIAADAEVAVLKEQVRRLEQELRITTQRVNLFEKVKIPETKGNIRKIRIYLGDEQTAAVVRGKIAKSNIVEAE